MTAAGSKYKKLTARFPLLPIKNEDDRAAAERVQVELFSRADDLDEDENTYLDLLNVLVRNYDKVHHPYPYLPATPLEVINFILEENNMKQADLARLLGISTGRASDIANGVREMSKAQIATFCDQFHLDAAFFLPKPKMQSARAGVSGSLMSRKPKTGARVAVTTKSGIAGNSKTGGAGKRIKSA
jgi:antitoxin component HigA of HigAB toxin-antitoxin module